MVELSSNFNIADSTSMLPASQLLVNLVSNNKGAFLGECHTNPRALELLTDSMPELSQKGVKFVFSEHFFRTDQHSLSHLQDKQDYDGIKELQIDTIENAVGIKLEELGDFQQIILDHINHITNVVQAANSNGVRVFGIDDPDLTIQEEYGRVSAELHEDWKSYIEDILQGNSDAKYVVIAGKGHSLPDSYGVDKLLDIPSLDSACMSNITSIPDGQAQLTSQVSEIKWGASHNASDYTFN